MVIGLMNPNTPPLITERNMLAKQPIYTLVINRNDMLIVPTSTTPYNQQI